MKIIFLIFVLNISICHAEDWYEEWSNAGKTWDERWDVTLNNINKYPNEKK